MGRKTEVESVHVKYKNGDETLWINVEGFTTEYVNHDAGNKRDREEWDEVEIHLVGPRRPLTREE